jgi:hypothetical protein
MCPTGGMPRVSQYYLLGTPFGINKFLMIQGGRVPEANNMAQMARRAWSTERASRTSGVESASTGGTREYDDRFDFPPTAHPGRELFTFSLFILLIITLLAWGGWKLISLI